MGSRPVLLNKPYSVLIFQGARDPLSPVWIRMDPLPAHEILVLVAYGSSESLDDPAQTHSLARAVATAAEIREYAH